MILTGVDLVAQTHLSCFDFKTLSLCPI